MARQDSGAAVRMLPRPAADASAVGTGRPPSRSPQSNGKVEPGLSTLVDLTLSCQRACDFNPWKRWRSDREWAMLTELNTGGPELPPVAPGELQEKRGELVQISVG